MEDFPWPEVTAWRRIAATPGEVMAVYADVASPSLYMPGMIASRVVGRDAPNVLRVFYEYEVPGPNERYTVIVTVHAAADTFEARWTLVSARYARRLAGELEAMPRDGATLVRYTSRVDPGVLGVTLGDPDSVARRLRTTVEALAARVERLATAEPDRLRQLVRALSAFLKSASVNP